MFQVLAVLAFASCIAAQSAPPGSKLLIVDLDDLGADFLEQEAPPFLTALDAASRSFRRFYTSPVCSPTRAQMHYGARASHPFVQMPWLTEEAHSPWDAPTAGPLVTLGQALSDAGISCAKIGKWHLGAPGNHQHPLDHGWDHFAGTLANVDSYFSYEWSCNGSSSFETEYLTSRETAEAIAAMEAGFRCVSVSYHAIHDPFETPPVGEFPAWVDTSTEVGRARAMLHALDRDLLELGIAAVSNGYHAIVFCDNGGLSLLGGDKGSIREGGIRCPMWAWGPGVVPGDDHSLCGVIDVYATVCEFFGIWRTPYMGPQSVSLIPAFLGAPGTRTSMFADRYPTNGEDVSSNPLEWRRAVVGPDYKLRIVGDVERMFLLPDESQDLLQGTVTSQEQAELDTLLAELDAWTL